MFKQFILTYHKIQDKKHHLSSTPSTISPALSRFHRIPLFFCSKDPRTQISHNALYERIILVQILERGIIHQENGELEKSDSFYWSPFHWKRKKSSCFHVDTKIDQETGRMVEKSCSIRLISVVSFQSAPLEGHAYKCLLASIIKPRVLLISSS